MRRHAARLGAALAAWLVAAPAPAAWLEQAGRGQVISTLTYSLSDRRFDGSGDLGGAPDFRKLEFSPYVQYGLTPDAMLVVQPSVQRLSSERAGGTARTAGLHDTEVGMRVPLRRFEDGSIVSVQPLVRLPLGYDPDDDPALGSGHPDGELRLLGGTKLDLAGLPAFADGQVAYRARLGDPADELRLDLTLGATVAEGWLVLAQGLNTLGVGAAGDRAEKFRSHKLQGSVVRRLAEDLSVQVGALRTVAGARTGRETAVLLSVWWAFGG